MHNAEMDAKTKVMHESKLNLNHCNVVTSSFINVPPVETKLSLAFINTNLFMVPVRKLWVFCTWEHRIKVQILVCSITVSYSSFRFSEVRHLGSNNLPCENIKTNFTNGWKIYRTRTNVVVFTANIINSSLHRTATRDYDVTGRRVVDSYAPY